MYNSKNLSVIDMSFTDLTNQLVELQKKKQKNPQRELFLMKSIADRKLADCPAPEAIFPLEPEKVRIVRAWMNKIGAYDCCTTENSLDRITYACFLDKYLNMGFLEEPFSKAPPAGELKRADLCLKGNLLKFQQSILDLQHLLSKLDVLQKK